MTKDIYYAGDLINGEVVLETVENLKLKGK